MHVGLTTFFRNRDGKHTDAEISAHEPAIAWLAVVAG